MRWCMFIFFEKLFHSCDKTKNALMRSMQFQEEYRQADHGRMHSYAGEGGISLVNSDDINAIHRRNPV